MRGRRSVVALCGLLAVGCTSQVGGTSAPTEQAGSTEQARCEGAEVSVEASGPLNELMPATPRYVTNPTPVMDRAMAGQELAQYEGERKVLSDAGFRAAWIRTFESGSDTIAEYRHETYYLYEFATANGACDYQQYIDESQRAEPLTVDSAPEATEVSVGASTAKEATTTIMATKGRFRIVATAEAREVSLARFGAMDIFDLFYAQVA